MVFLVIIRVVALVLVEIMVGIIEVSIICRSVMLCSFSSGFMIVRVFWFIW